MREQESFEFLEVPEKNMRDVEDITTEITKGLEIIPVIRMEDVLEIAFVKEEK